MRTTVIIPARYGSTRFPGKPLAEIAGKSMVRRVAAIAAAANGVDEVVVATDDTRILTAVQAFGGTAIMTDPACRNGTERAYDALQRMQSQPDIIINLQGDAVLTPPWIIGAVVQAMRADPGIGLCTPAAKLSAEALVKLQGQKAAGEVGGTSVVCNKFGYALYFSKTIIPYLRNTSAAPVFKHIGLYGYTPDMLATLNGLPEMPLERAEGLEQLRALENGIPIKVVEVDYRGRTPWAVDSPEDRQRAEDIIAREGELIDWSLSPFA